MDDFDIIYTIICYLPLKEQLRLRQINSLWDEAITKKLKGMKELRIEDNIWITENEFIKTDMFYLFPNLRKLELSTDYITGDGFEYFRGIQEIILVAVEGIDFKRISESLNHPEKMTKLDIEYVLPIVHEKPMELLLDKQVNLRNLSLIFYHDFVLAWAL